MEDKILSPRKVFLKCQVCQGMPLFPLIVLHSPYLKNPDTVRKRTFHEICDVWMSTQICGSFAGLGATVYPTYRVQDSLAVLERQNRFNLIPQGKVQSLQSTHQRKQ